MQARVHQAGTTHKSDQGEGRRLTFLECRLKLPQGDPVIKPNQLGVMRFLTIIDQSDLHQPGLDLVRGGKRVVSSFDGKLRNLRDTSGLGGRDCPACAQSQGYQHDRGQSDKNLFLVHCLGSP